MGKRRTRLVLGLVLAIVASVAIYGFTAANTVQVPQPVPAPA